MKQSKKISILSPDLSSNSTGRSYLLAKMLQKKYAVDIIGPCLKGSIWSPLKGDSSINFVTIKNRFNLFELIRKMDGDVIYSIKPLFPSFPYGLIKSFLYRKKFILDIDDWELGFQLGNLKENKKISLSLHGALNFISVLMLEFLSFLVKRKTVSNTFLQNRFGGEIIPHARDEKTFIKDKSTIEDLRKKLGLVDKKVILFLGTAGKQKGLEDLITAFKKVNKKDLFLLIVGLNKKNNIYHKTFISKYSSEKNIKILGEVPFKIISHYLFLADLIVLPQKKSFSAIGQVPAKVFDAMACGKPIIATNISDLPIILKDCGVIVESGDIDELSEKISYLLDNPKIAKELGRKAREKFLKEYSFKVIEPKLFKIFDEVISIGKKPI